MMKSFMVAVGLVAVLCMGCGATVRNSQGGMVRQSVYVTNTNGEAVPGTKVYVNGKHVGNTNEWGMLKYDIPGPQKGDSFKLKIQKSGFKPISREVRAVVDGGFVAGDIFLGLFLGVIPIIITLAVDGATESWLAYPRSMEFVLGAEHENQD